MFTFLLVVHAIIAAALVAVILMQRSEGGGLGMGGSPSGLMSARGAADFLTRATTILATLFVLMSIGLAALATVERAPREIDTSLARQPAPAAPDAVPLGGDPVIAPTPVPAPSEGPAMAPVPVTPPPAERAPAPTRSPPATGNSATPAAPAREAPAARPASERGTVGNPAVSNFSLPAANSTGSVPLGE